MSRSVWREMADNAMGTARYLLRVHDRSTGSENSRSGHLWRSSVKSTCTCGTRVDRASARCRCEGCQEALRAGAEGPSETASAAWVDERVLRWGEQQGQSDILENRGAATDFLASVATPLGISNQSTKRVRTASASVGAKSSVNDQHDCHDDW